MSSAVRRASRTTSVRSTIRSARTRATSMIRSASCCGPLEHLVALLQQPARLAQLLGQAVDRVLEDLAELVAVQHHRRRQRHRSAPRRAPRAAASSSAAVSGTFSGSSSSISSLPQSVGLVVGLRGNISDEPVGDVRRHHARHVAAEPRDLAHQARRQERVLRAGRDEERVDARRGAGSSAPSGARSRSRRPRAGPSRSRRRRGRCAKSTSRPLKNSIRMFAEVRRRLLQHLLALFEAEQRLRLLRIADHGDDDVVEVPRRCAR